MVAPHIHPRATEILVNVAGPPLMTGVIPEAGAPCKFCSHSGLFEYTTNTPISQPLSDMLVSETLPSSLKDPSTLLQAPDVTRQSSWRDSSGCSPPNLGTFTECVVFQTVPNPLVSCSSPKLSPLSTSKPTPLPLEALVLQ